jgi:hypothetical protein
MTSEPTTSQVAAGAPATVALPPSASPFGPALYPILQLRSAPLQRTVRIVGFGPASGGTGALSGVGGLFHSVVFNALPPVPSSFYMVRIADPEGRYRE